MGGVNPFKKSNYFSLNNLEVFYHKNENIVKLIRVVNYVMDNNLYCGNISLKVSTSEAIFIIYIIKK